MEIKFRKLVGLVGLIFFISCTKEKIKKEHSNLRYAKNILNYKVSPQKPYDKSGLMFSDQGAWFAYSTGESGFTGPFLMTQQNGVWSSKSLTELKIEEEEFRYSSEENYPSHLSQIFTNSQLKMSQKLVFLSANTALIEITITNTSKFLKKLSYSWKNKTVLADSLNFSTEGDFVKINSNKTPALGYLKFYDIKNKELIINKDGYKTFTNEIDLEPNQSISIYASQTFIFPEYSWEKEQELLKNLDFDKVLEERKIEKEIQLNNLFKVSKKQYTDSIYKQTLAKAHLTLQNNWRVPAGEIKFEGLFPSYHYKWFNGFWSWDSWKHAVGLAQYNTKLAQNQIKLMFEFQNEDGFVADCVYRDTSIEAHNYRDTKPPLAAWSVAKVFQKDIDTTFVKYMYPRLKKYHNWWYTKRDHDQDGLCEYGSTDGSLVAAKWESGMDNAIRFDDSKILKNSEGAYSLDQESVDLNAYLYAEKLYLSELANILGLEEDYKRYIKEAQSLKTKIQTQFYDKNDGWFYDTNLKGDEFIKGEGSEGWTALWANAATHEQAKAVKERMMNPKKFFTKVPFQTMSADHEKFDPLRGYWRGPNWLDQAYFGVKGLRNYGFNEEADKATVQILKGCEGLLDRGSSIRENYHPISGKGLNAQNFSWSAAHIIMLLTD